MFNQNYQGMPQGMPQGGFAYNGFGAPVTKFNNPLSPDEIKRLQQKDNQFSLAITEEEFLRAACNHRNAEGTSDTLAFDQVTGKARCAICGYEFRPVSETITPEDIKEDVSVIIDILQTIKLMYIDLPADAAKEYFQIIPLLEKIPQLFEFAAKNMAKHETYNWRYNNANMGAINMFNNLQNIFGGGMNMGAPMYGGQPQGQPFVPQPNPVYAQPGMPAGYPQAPMTNGFGYPGASNYQPTAPGFQYTPQPGAVPAATVAAPAAPEAKPEDTTTVTQTVGV